MRFPKPKKKSKPQRSQKKFREAVLAADNWTCQNPYCPFHGSEPGAVIIILDAHHIDKKGDDSIDNGITLCRFCHEAVEGRRSITTGAGSFRGRKLMIIIIRSKSPNRWEKAVEAIERSLRE